MIKNYETKKERNQRYYCELKAKKHLVGNQKGKKLSSLSIGFRKGFLASLYERKQYFKKRKKRRKFNDNHKKRLLMVKKQYDNNRKLYNETSQNELNEMRILLDNAYKK